MANDISQIRRDYSGQYLNASTVGKDPIELFEKWFNEALTAGVDDANAFHLSSLGTDGYPDGRILLIKGVEDGKFVFYTNYESKKGLDLRSTPRAAMTFYYKELDRQIRIQGDIQVHQSEASDEYFLSRPIKSRIGAWVSKQSKAIPSRVYLMRKFVEFSIKNKGKQVTRPPFWGGFALSPIRIEFWQGRPSRLHDRISFKLGDDGWVIERLSP